MLLSHIILWVRNWEGLAWAARLCSPQQQLKMEGMEDLCTGQTTHSAGKLLLVVGWEEVGAGCFLGTQKGFSAVCFSFAPQGPLHWASWASSPHAVSRGSVPRDKDGSCKSFSDLDSKVPGSQFFCIILVKRITKTRPYSTRGQSDSTSQ